MVKSEMDIHHSEAKEQFELELEEVEKERKEVPQAGQEEIIVDEKEEREGVEIQEEEVTEDEPQRDFCLRVLKKILLVLRWFVSFVFCFFS